jgi:hypothetical protein
MIGCDGDTAGKIETLQKQVGALELNLVELSGAWGPFQSNDEQFSWDANGAWDALRSEFDPRVGSNLNAEAVAFKPSGASADRECAAVKLLQRAWRRNMTQPHLPAWGNFLEPCCHS